MHFYCMQLNKLQLDLLEQDYWRRHVLVPRSGSVKIYELQSALAQKCAAQVEQEEVHEAQAAAIRSFKMAVAAVCPPLPPTKRGSYRKIAVMPASVGRMSVKRAVDNLRDMNKHPSSDRTQLKAPKLEAPPEPHHTDELPRPLDPTAARSSHVSHAALEPVHDAIAGSAVTAAMLPSLPPTPAQPATQGSGGAEHRKHKQEAWQADQQAKSSQHGGVIMAKVQNEVMPQDAALPPTAEKSSAELLKDAEIVETVNGTAVDNAHNSAAAEHALAASRDRREARREAQAASREWCGPTPTSIFDVPMPPRKFIDSWHSRYTPCIGGSPFGAQPLNV
eukprot:CAMPEP_0119298188 /NCGR_PEP_ID=MMETSP1333-20130426/386_1 /TAXON_ID=418940 /ORGANISM="Scyphosphaera apsteinii, Strain RCC1455" /LENGTH=333 /DNA_ID=CAMNT_0007299223 /DNA_START=56 /DNA_END=1053 /DNA_ORIENTATION=+